MSKNQMRKPILELADGYAAAENAEKQSSVPGKTVIPRSGKVLGATEMKNTA
jgi:hypothetical protein